jgi:CDP-4-dehydro-6-deoxyglucose reductase
MPWKWYDSQVVDIVDQSASTKSFWLRIDDMSAFDFTPGQFITLDLPLGEKRRDRWRSYSIANVPTKEEGLIELCIVKLAGGSATSYLFSQLQKGDKLRFKGPDGNFVLPDLVDKELVMVCTGTGIAPFRSMLIDLRRKGSFGQRIHLIYGTRFQADMLYRLELEALAAEEPNFLFTTVLSRDTDWKGAKGYVHQIYLENYSTANQNRLFMLCGWSMMIDEAVTNLIVKLGYEKSQIKYELYG